MADAWFGILVLTWLTVYLCVVLDRQRRNADAAFIAEHRRYLNELRRVVER